MVGDAARELSQEGASVAAYPFVGIGKYPKVKDGPLAGLSVTGFGAGFGGRIGWQRREAFGNRDVAAFDINCLGGITGQVDGAARQEYIAGPPFIVPRIRLSHASLTATRDAPRSRIRAGSPAPIALMTSVKWLASNVSSD